MTFQGNFLCVCVWSSKINKTSEPTVSHSTYGLKGVHQFSLSNPLLMLNFNLETSHGRRSIKSFVCIYRQSRYRRSQYYRSFLLTPSLPPPASVVYSRQVSRICNLTTYEYFFAEKSIMFHQPAISFTKCYTFPSEMLQDYANFYPSLPKQEMFIVVKLVV